MARNVAEELHDTGFVIIAGPVVSTDLPQLVAAYDAAVSGADPTDVSIGRSTTRVNDLVNRGPDFDGLYVFRPILSACCSIIGQSLRLSTMHARTVNPNSPAQALHVDFRREKNGWPMVGFIIMVDVSARERGHTICAGLASMAHDSKRPDEGSRSRLRAPGTGTWAGRLSHCVQRICLAWTRCKPDRRASAFNTRRLHLP